jgi:amidase
MARSVADAAILLGALTGVDSRDSATKRGTRRAARDYTGYLRVGGLKGSRIGVARKLAGTDVRVLRIFDQSLDAMKQAGAVLIDPVELKGYDNLAPSELEVLYFEFKADLNRYLASREPSAKIRSLADVIRFNEENSALVMPFFGQERMTAAQSRGPLSSKKYRTARAKSLRLARTDGIDATMRRFRLDAIVVPTGGPAWLIDLVGGDSLNWDMESSSLPAVAGYPHISVPAGYVFGLPVGISFVGKAWQEGTLLKLAYAFERASPIRRPPLFRASADLSN